MTRLLHIVVSARGEASRSRRAGRAVLADQISLHVVERDLADPLVPHPDAAFMRASLMLEEQRGEAERRALTLSETLIGELEAAECVLISTPMHNFTVPSLLKAWIDYVVRPRRTFRSTPTGKQGLLADRPVLALVACGGRFGADPGAQQDFLTPYLRYALGCVGITDVHSILMQGLTRSEESLEPAAEAARAWLAGRL
jgi:FMN-dependent NADH-azoreductase